MHKEKRQLLPENAGRLGTDTHDKIHLLHLLGGIHSWQGRGNAVPDLSGSGEMVVPEAHSLYSVLSSLGFFLVCKVGVIM